MATTLTSIGSGALNIAVMIFSIIAVFGFVTGAIFLLMKWRRYQEYKIVIWYFDAFGQISQKHDSAGLFVKRKTKSKRLWLKKGKVGLSPDNIPVINTAKGKTVYLLQIGAKNFRYINPDFKKGQYKFTVGEQDVNWAIHEYEADKKQFQDNVLLQYMPFIAIGFVTIVILIIFMYFFKEFGTLKEVAVAFENAAKNFALTQSGTTVIT